ncbi:O-antigen ligase family protein [Candidatus Methylomirabilis sp.]|uniref:O-antigen ligase family protein n=1 Tax=Candidatus Methylomirabilis sp. TaxID=2032687 RepID=UPI0030762DC0
MQISVSRNVPMEPWLLAGVGLCLTLLIGGVVYLGSPVLVPVLITALLVGCLILFRPDVGVLLLFATMLFKYPKFLEGSGWLTINNLLGLMLSAILLATIAVRKQLWFLKVRQVQLFLLIGLVIFLNWLVVGRIEAPAYLSRFDLTGDTVERYITRLSFLIFFVAFIRTSRQLLLVTAMLLVAIFLTIPDAISHSLTATGAVAGKVERLRATATVGIEAARNANYLAFICLMGITLVWFALAEHRGTLLRLLGGMAILPLVLAIFLSGSRGGVINLTLLPFLLLGQSGMRRGRAVAVVVLLVLSVSMSLVLVPQSIRHRLGTFLPTYEDDAVSQSTELRLLMQNLGLNRFWESPIVGVGIGNVRWMNAMDPASGGIPLAAHNAYLLALAEGGVILLGAYLLLFWQTFRDLGNTLTLAALIPDVNLKWLVLATRTNLILLLVFSIFTDTWKEFWFFIIVGTTAVLSQLYQKAAERS